MPLLPHRIKDIGSKESLLLILLRASSLSTSPSHSLMYHYFQLIVPPTLSSPLPHSTLHCLLLLLLARSGRLKLRYFSTDFHASAPPVLFSTPKPENGCARALEKRQGVVKIILVCAAKASCFVTITSP